MEGHPGLLDSFKEAKTPEIGVRLGQQIQIQFLAITWLPGQLEWSLNMI